MRQDRRRHRRGPGRMHRSIPGASRRVRVFVRWMQFSWRAFELLESEGDSGGCAGGYGRTLGLGGESRLGDRDGVAADGNPVGGVDASGTRGAGDGGGDDSALDGDGCATYSYAALGCFYADLAGG